MPKLSFHAGLAGSSFVILTHLSACGGETAQEQQPQLQQLQQQQPQQQQPAQVQEQPDRLLATTTATAVAGAPTIYTIGDSTVMSYGPALYPRAGWGQVLPWFFDTSKVAFANKAVGGTSAKSYYDTYWNNVKPLIKPGDYVTIGFGINDSTRDPRWYSDPFTTFQDYLTRFANETRARGAYPIIVATQPRNLWTATSPPRIYPAYHNYPVASRQLAAELGLPLIDLDRSAIALFQALGQSYSTNFIYNYYQPGQWPNFPNGTADSIHFQENGAIELARLVVSGLRSASANPNVSRLLPLLKPTYRVTFTSNNSAAGQVSRSEYFPAGATVLAYARPYAGYHFLSWNGGLSGSRPNLTFTMGTTARTINATFWGSAATYQSEAAVVSGMGTDNAAAYSGYNGSGYVVFGSSGGSLAFLNAEGGDGGGERTLRIRYALGGSSARTGQLVVNGVATSISFAPTGAFNSWATKELAVTLNSGASNSIIFRSTGYGLPAIDELTVR